MIELSPAALGLILTHLHGSPPRPAMPRFAWGDLSRFSDYWLDLEGEYPEPCPRLEWAHRPFTHTIGPVPAATLLPERLRRYRQFLDTPE